ncbi:hypothetical protein [Streptomyces buecherae]
MNFPNPFDGPSPWGETDKPKTADEEVPDGFRPYKIGMTLKSGPGYEAEWITPAVYGRTATEAAQAAVDLLTALAAKGVIPTTSAASVAVRQAHQPAKPGAAAGPGPAPGAQAPAPAAAAPTFQNGRVVLPDQAPDQCPHGRTFREGTGAKGPWAAMFCSGPQGAQCDPLWRQKDGSFKANG